MKTFYKFEISNFNKIICLTPSQSSEKKLSVPKVCWRKKFLKLHEYVSINILEVAESESEARITKFKIILDFNKNVYHFWGCKIQT